MFQKEATDGKKEMVVTCYPPTVTLSLCWHQEMKVAKQPGLKAVEEGGASHAAAVAKPMPTDFMSVLRGNMTPWWFMGTVYTVFFLSRLGVPRIFYDTPMMGFHIPMAFLFVLACAWNLYHTPHQGPIYRVAHVWVGWTAMVVGVLSVMSGYAYILDGTSQLPLGTKVLMMAIGLIQLGLQGLGLWYVRGRKWIQMHMSMMTYLYYNSAVLIAINWIPKMATGHALNGAAQTNWTFISMLGGLTLANLAVKYNRKNMDLSDDL
jgi:hypothetical protein